MLKQIVVGILVFTILAVAGAGIAYQITQAAAKTTSPKSESLDPLDRALIESPSQGNVQEQTDFMAVNEPASLGEDWKATGTITWMDDNGLELALENGDSAYVELGPSSYWKEQDVELYPGQTVTIVGSITDGMIHASQVELEDGQLLEIRNEFGQPLWSGGVSNGRGNRQDEGSGNVAGERSPDPQAQVDEWVTIEGTLYSFQGASMTLATPTGELVSIQAGQPRFFASQGITLQVGDELSVLGFYEGEKFNAGEITHLATGNRIMLRDPNGRPLWAGPGNGNSNGNGNGKGGANH